VGNDPNQIALSSDDQYLFVGADGDHTIQRIKCSTMAIEKSYTLPLDSVGAGRDMAAQIVPVPGSATKFVAVLWAQRSPSTDGVALFDDGGLINHLPYDYPNYTEVNGGVFASDPSVFYGMPFETFGASFFKVVTIDALGLHYTRPSPPYVGEANAGFRVFSDGTLLFTNNGQIYDPVTKSKVGSLALTSTAYIAFDNSNGKVLAITGSDKSPSDYQATGLSFYNKSNYTVINKLYFDAVRTGFEPMDMVRWGTDGLAFVTGSDFQINARKYVIVLRTSLISGSLSNTPSISSLTPSQARVNSAAVTLTLKGSGFTADSVVKWKQTTLTSTFVNSGELTAVVPAALLTSLGSATITVSNASTGGGTAVTTFVIVGAPHATLSGSSLSFGAVAVNSSSAAKDITISNAGSTALSISKWNVTGDFSQTNTCGSSLEVNGSCTVSVVFKPTAGGSRSGSISIDTDADNTPHSITLTGSGGEMNIETPGGSSATATVTAGQTASFSLSVASSGGFTGAVTLECAGTPLYGSCSVSPSSTNLIAGGSSAFSVNVKTTDAANVASLHTSSGILASFIFAAGMLFALPLRRRKLRLNAACSVLAIALALGGALGLASCGGGGSGGGGSPTPVTHTVAPGTYTLQVTASSGTIQKSLPVTLVVK
jgi:hypothetical protein